MFACVRCYDVRQGWRLFVLFPAPLGIGCGIVMMSWVGGGSCSRGESAVGLVYLVGWGYEILRLVVCVLYIGIGCVVVWGSGWVWSTVGFGCVWG